MYKLLKTVIGNRSLLIPKYKVKNVNEIMNIP